MKRWRLSFNLIKKRVYIVYGNPFTMSNFYFTSYNVITESVYMTSSEQCAAFFYPKLKSPLTVSKIYFIFINFFSHILEILLNWWLFMGWIRRKRISTVKKNGCMKKIKHLIDRLCAFFVLHHFGNCRLLFSYKKILFFVVQQKSITLIL